MDAFSQGDIESLSELFGQSDLITKLNTHAKRHDKVNLIGAKKLGKTCVLKTLKSSIKENPESKVYPFYIDIRESDIKSNTAAVYRYLIAVLLSDLNQDGYWCDDDITLSSITFHSNDQWEDLFDDPVLSAQTPSKTKSIFYNLVKKINMEIDKSVLILFDEYEHLLKYAFTDSTGFYKIRSMTDDRNLSFSFIVAGREPWNKLVTKIGSGELINVSIQEPIPPLSKGAFQELWSYECAKIEDISLREKIQSYEGLAFEKSGGFPFFGKCIGSYLVVNNAKFPSCFNVSINEILNSLVPEEKILLHKINNGEEVLLNPSLDSLISKGIVDEDGPSYRITMGYLRDAISSNDYVSELRRNFEMPCEELAKEAISLVQTINNTRKNNGFPYTFEPVNDSGSIEEDLRTQCSNKTDFEDFCAALYRNHFERSKGDKCIKQRLPNKFNKTQFVEIVDVLRHSYGAHERDLFVVRNDWMSLPEALKIIHGSTNEPYLPEDFSNMQVKLLEMYKKELKGILKKAQDGTWTA